jgi:trimethylamine--corrinoid protein Co-methyltransferase
MPDSALSARPTLKLLQKDDIQRIHEASLKLLEEVGVMIYNDRALKLLGNAGVEIDARRKIARIPHNLAEESLAKAPSTIRLYSQDGVHDRILENDRVTFNPGSAALFFLDSKTGEVRRPLTKDLVDLVRLADALEYIHAQSTALVVSDVPDIIADRYRLHLVLKNSPKPIITGAFSIDGFHDMKRMLEVAAGGAKEAAEKPRAIFDTCPSAPLKWSEVTSQNLLDCAKSHIPAEIIPMPQLGATGPVTLAGSLVQHNTEFLSGLVMAQLTTPGAPVIYGGSPTTLDMRYGTARLGAIETMMLGCSYAQIGKHYNLPTHTYLGLSDTKIIDAQCGFESGIAIVLGALAGINVISGPGMLNFENCQSLEKLVIDNTICGMALRLVDGVQVTDETLAVDLIRKVGPGGMFLAEKHTLEWFRKERFIPSELIDRKELNTWKTEGAKSTVQRAKEIVETTLKEHSPTPLQPEVANDLDNVMTAIRKAHA